MDMFTDFCLNPRAFYGITDITIGFLNPVNPLISRSEWIIMTSRRDVTGMMVYFLGNHYSDPQLISHYIKLYLCYIPSHLLFHYIVTGYTCKYPPLWKSLCLLVTSYIYCFTVSLFYPTTSIASLYYNPLLWLWCLTLISFSFNPIYLIHLWYLYYNYAIIHHWLVVWNMAFMFHDIWGNPSHWLICFKMVQTTNQIKNDIPLSVPGPHNRFIPGSRTVVAAWSSPARHVWRGTRPVARGILRRPRRTKWAIGRCNADRNGWWDKACCRVRNLWDLTSKIMHNFVGFEWTK